MSEFHIAGLANDPNFADAEVVLDDLAMNLPDVTVRKHMRDKVRTILIVFHDVLTVVSSIRRASGPSGSSSCAVAWASQRSFSLT